MAVRFLPLAAIFAGLVAIPVPAGAGPALGSLAVSVPVAHGNLAVYFVHRGAGTASPLVALHQALGNGTARIAAYRNSFPRIDNFSDRPIFVPAGTLLTGGVQDQVVMSSVIVPPQAVSLPIVTLCVE